MKKFLFSLTAAAFALSATAAGPTIIDGFSSIKLMPPVVTAKGETYIICHDENSVAIFDKNLKQKAGFSFPVEQEFTFSEWEEHRYDSDESWSPRQEFTRTETVNNYSELYIAFDGSDADEYYATQTFFNNDSKFEYIVPKYELRDYHCEGENLRRGGQAPIITAFEIMSHDGTNIMTLTIPDEYLTTSGSGNGIQSDLKAILIEEKKYLLVEHHTFGYNRTTLFYEIDGTSGVKAPAMVMEGAMKVHPTLPRRGETVTVDLGAAAQPGCRIAMTAVNGRNALNLRAENGATSVNIPTASLAAGMYIVTVTNGTSSTEAAKIIIR